MDGKSRRIWGAKKMNVTIKGEPTTIEAYMIANTTLCPPNHIKIARFTFNCETIEDANGTVFRKERKGKWIDLGKDMNIRWQCSECGRKDTQIYNYCPSCGADMREEE